MVELRRRNSLVALLIFAAAGTTHGQIYRCEKDGKITFSDKSCDPGAKSTSKDAVNLESVDAVDMQVELTDYSVQGQDYDSLLRSLSANGPNGYHAFARWNLNYTYTTKRHGDDCKIDSVKSAVSGHVLMPRWSNQTSAPPALQQRWNEYYAALKLHEYGHVQHGKEMALLLRQQLVALGLVPCDQLHLLTRKQFDRLYGSFKTRDQEYDSRTNHGESQGAVFRRPR